MPVNVKAGTEKASSRRKESGVEKGEKELVELEGKKEFFRLRTLWSTWIITWISFLIIVNVILTIAVGDGHLNYEKYQWFITTVTVETFLQTVGLGYVAAKFLFNSN